MCFECASPRTGLERRDIETIPCPYFRLYFQEVYQSRPYPETMFIFTPVSEKIIIRFAIMLAGELERTLRSVGLL